MFHILIVDDEPIILNGCRMMITELLELDFQVSVSTAQSVSAAEKILLEQPVDLVLADIRMPVRDGFDLIRFAGENALTPDFVILTSHASFDYAQKGIRLGVRDFILKPINEEQLRAVITASRARKEQREQALLKSRYHDILTMLRYDITPGELMLESKTVAALFPLPWFQVIAVQFAAEMPQEKDYPGILDNYCPVSHAFVLRDVQQFIWICNFNSPAELSVKAEPLLRDAFHAPFLFASSMYTDLFDNLHSLYVNVQQKLFYSRVFGENASAVSASLFSYQDCLAVLFSEREETERAVSTLLRRLSVRRDDTPQAFSMILESFRQNLVLYYTNSQLTVPEKLQETLPVPASYAELKQAVIRLTDTVREQTRDNRKEDGDRQVISHLLKYIRTHYREDLSLDDLAKAVGLQPGYICTLFRSQTGNSFLTFLHQERIREAKQLLESTDDTMEVIAGKVGYNSTTQFNRVFRKYTQMTPAEYRKSHSG